MPKTDAANIRAKGWIIIELPYDVATTIWNNREARAWCKYRGQELRGFDHEDGRHCCYAFKDEETALLFKLMWIG